VLLRHGLEGVVVAGGATSLIGDPGGKDSERPLQDERVVGANVEKIRLQLQNLVGKETKLINNLDWFKSLGVLEFLRDTGKYFSMTPILQRDYIAKRIGEGGSGITYTELSYTLLQGYDFLQLFEKYGVNLQIAGSDQWGNSLSGAELIRKVKNKEANVITCPLIVNKSTGKKFGKSEEGAVWLDPKKTSVLDFYQFWISLDDEGVADHLKIYTELDKEEIADIMAKQRANPASRQAQTRLAYEVTKFVHGKAEADKAKKDTEVITGDVDIQNMTKTDAIDSGMKLVVLSSAPADLIDILVDAELASSRSEANRLIASNAIYINDVSFNKLVIDKSDFTENSLLLIRKGKNRANSAIIELK